MCGVMSVASRQINGSTTGNGKMSVGAPKGLICSFGIICQAGDNV